MRGAGCTWNDIVDRDLDKSVERTASRPIPSGQVSVRQAAAFLVLQALVGLAVLLSFNGFTIALGIASLVIVAVYPFMKRITFWRRSFWAWRFPGRADGLGGGLRPARPPRPSPLCRIDLLGDSAMTLSTPTRIARTMR